METGRVRCVRISLAALSLALAACTSSGSTPAAAPTPPAPTSAAPATTPSSRPTGTPSGVAWSTYHGDGSRTGVTRAPSLRPPLRRAWTRRLDGAVYGQPIVAGSAVIA